MLIRLRSGLFAATYFIFTVTYGTLSLLLWFIPATWRHKVLISWCWLIIYLLRLICGVRYSVTGRENLTQANLPAVVLSKHQSTWETLALQGIFWPASTILKQELLKIPFFGWGLRGLQPIAIDRSNPREALKQVKEQGVLRLKQGKNVLLFPEGTRVAPGKKNKYARSGADIAVAAGVPIIPVAVNAGHCWPIKSLLRIPGLVSVVIGEPIETQGRNSKDLIAEVEVWIEAQMALLDGQPSQLAQKTAQT